MVSFMPWLLHPQSKSSQYPLDRRMCAHQSWSGCGGEKKKVPAPLRNETSVI